MDKIEEKIVQARVSLINSHPFWGALSLRLHVQPTEAVPTMGVDGKNLFYNPAWADALPFEQLKGVMAHEVMHCALAHHTRFNGRDPQTWNEACDHAINPILREAGFELPPDGLSVKTTEFAGQAAEEIYSTLWGRKTKVEQDQPQSRGQGQGQGQSGKGKGADKDQSKKRGKGQADEDADTDDAGEGENEDEGGEGGEKGEGEREQPKDVGGCGSFSEPKEEDGKPAKKSTVEQEQRDWQIATAQALSVAKKAGNLPGGMAQALDKARAPQVDWREQLRRFVDSATKQNYSWTPPNRRHVAAGMYLPSVSNDGLGEIVFAIDTSGSMDNPSLEMAVSELNSILNDLNPETVHVIQCDTRVNKVESVHAGDYPLKVTALGRGGTMFTPVFDKIEEMNIRPVCLIYFTDLYACDFPAEPEYPVLWAVPPHGTDHAPFGEVIKVLADGRE